MADCSAVLIFGEITSPRSRGLIRDCRALGKPWVHVQAGLSTPRMIVRFLLDSRVKVLMIAGNRESTQLGIGARVERFLLAVFRSLGARNPEA